MLFSSKPPQSATPPTQNSASGFVFDVTAQDFEARVLQASNEKPILIDFWAPWCAPCKQLGPMLEKLVEEAKGAVLMAKVNIDENPELAQAFQVQSVPTVMAIYQGRPVTGFQGVQPESSLKQLISQLSSIAGDAHGAEQDDIDTEAFLKQADEALNGGDMATAQNLYGAILQIEPENAAAFAGMIRSFIRTGHIEQAQSLVDHAPESLTKDPAYLSAVKALQMAKDAPQGDLEDLRKKAEKDKATPEDRLTYAQALFGRGDTEAGIEAMLELIRTHKDWDNEKARTSLLEFFDALGPTHPHVIQGRKKLSRLLFS